MLAKNRWGICWANLERKIETMFETMMTFFFAVPLQVLVYLAWYAAHIYTQTLDTIGWADKIAQSASPSKNHDERGELKTQR